MSTATLISERKKLASDYGIAWSDQTEDALEGTSAWSDELSESGRESVEEGLRLSGLVDACNEDVVREMCDVASQSAADRWSDLARWRRACERAEKDAENFDHVHGTLRAGIYDSGSEFADAYVHDSNFPADMPDEILARVKDQLQRDYDRARAAWIGSASNDLIKSWYASHAHSSAPAPSEFKVATESDIRDYLFAGDEDEERYAAMDLLDAIADERRHVGEINLRDGGRQYDQDLVAAATAVADLRAGKNVWLASDNDGLWFC